MNAPMMEAAALFVMASKTTTVLRPTSRGRSGFVGFGFFYFWAVVRLDEQKNRWKRKVKMEAESGECVTGLRCPLEVAGLSSVVGW